MKRIFVTVTILLFSTLVFSQTVQDAEHLIYHERYKSAAKTLHAILENEPNNEQAWYLLTNCHLEQNKPNEIKDSLQKASQAVSDKPLIKVAYGWILLRQNDVAGAKQNFDAALKETRQKNAGVLMAIAKAYIDTKNADANYAVELLNKAIKRNKQNAELYVLLGDAYSKLSNGSDAYSAYKKALEINPKYARASYRLGKIFTSQKNPVYMQYFEDAVNADSLYTPALFEIYYHYYFRDVAKAMVYLQKYVEASDFNEENDYLMTDMLYLNKHYKAAIKNAQHIIATQGDSAQARIYKLIANSYKKLNDTTNARDYMLRYFATNNDTTYLTADYETMGEIYASMSGREDSSAYYYILAAEKTTTDSAKFSLYKKVAGLFEKKKDYKQQAEWLRKYYVNNATATNVDLFNCGVAYYYAGEYPVADSVYTVYTEKYPEQEYGYYWRARSNVAMDTAMEKGLAIPHYLKLIEIAEKDTTDETNRKRLIESYGYIASFKANHDKDYTGSMEYFEKILRLQPDNEDARKYVAILQKFISQGSN